MLPVGDQDEVELFHLILVTRRQHRRCFIPQSSALEDGGNYHLKHVELIEVINKIIIFTSTWLFILLY